MKRILLLIAVGLTYLANANNYRGMEPPTLETLEIKAELVNLPEQNPTILTTPTVWECRPGTTIPAST